MFSSPREEALEIAHNTRKRILEGNKDVVSIVRSCLVIANILNKKEIEKWCLVELSGYNEKDTVPQYRLINCFYEDTRNFDNTSTDFTPVKVTLDIHVLSTYLEKNQMIRFHSNEKVNFLNQGRLSQILCGIMDKCLIFLNAIITELQYGGTVEFLMEEIRQNTDEKLMKLDTKLVDEAQSMFINLNSTNPADWNKVGHSSRKMLKILADNVFPATSQKYTMKDKTLLDVDDPHFINRLCAFLDQKLNSKERKLAIAEIEYFQSYLRQVTGYAQKGEHKVSIEKYHADMLAIHTYLIMSEILKHKD